MTGGWDSAADLWKDPAEVPDPASVAVPLSEREHADVMASSPTVTATAM